MTMFFVLYINRMYSRREYDEKENMLYIWNYCWKIATIIFAFWGVCLQARDDGGFIRSNTYLYFTIISNLETVIIFSVFVVLRIVENIKGKQIIPKPLFMLKFMITAAMTITLTVAALLLAPLKDNVYLFSMKNLSLHIIAPILAMIDFLMIDRGFEYKWKMTFLGFILPLLYLAMTLLISVKGITYSNGTNFPYYFLNYRELGWFNLNGGMPGVAWWILIVAVMAFAVTYLLLAFKRAVMKIQGIKD